MVSDLKFILQKWIRIIISVPFFFCPSVICPGYPLIIIAKEDKRHMAKLERLFAVILETRKQLHHHVSRK